MGSLLKKVTGKSLKIAAKAKAEEQDQEAEDEDENLDAEDEDETTAEGEDEDQSAEDDEDDTTAEDEEDVDAEDEDPEAEDEEQVPASKTKAKAKGEKARIGAILGHPAAKGRRKLAEHIALNTNLGVKAAAEMLRASAKATPSTAAKGNGFDARMRAAGNPKIGTAPGGPGKKNPDADAAAGVLATARMIGLTVKN